MSARALTVNYTTKLLSDGRQLSSVLPYNVPTGDLFYGPVDDSNEVLIWCREHFGEECCKLGVLVTKLFEEDRQWDWQAQEFYFKKELHAIHFKLRWIGS